MSNPWTEHYFPLCFLCGSGNYGAAICLNPMCHETYGLKIIKTPKLIEINENDHSWKLCELCNEKILADPGAWGSFAICIDCWNAYVEAGRYPPTSIIQIIHEINSGELIYKRSKNSDNKVHK